MPIFSFRTIFELIGSAVVILNNQESSITVRLLNPCMGTSISSRSELQQNIIKDSCHLSIDNLRLTSQNVLFCATKLMKFVAARINDDELLSKLESNPCLDGFPCITNNDGLAPSIPLRQLLMQYLMKTRRVLRFVEMIHYEEVKDCSLCSFGTEILKLKEQMFTFMCLLHASPQIGGTNKRDVVENLKLDDNMLGLSPSFSRRLNKEYVILRDIVKLFRSFTVCLSSKTNCFVQNCSN